MREQTNLQSRTGSRFYAAASSYRRTISGVVPVGPRAQEFDYAASRVTGGKLAGQDRQTERAPKAMM